MKAKTVKATIRKKIDAWLETIDDEPLRERLKHGVIVTGGCITSMLLKEPVNDYDIYLRSYELARDVAKYYVGKFELKVANGIECKIMVWAAPPAASGERPIITPDDLEVAGDTFIDKQLWRLGWRADRPWDGKVEVVIKSAGIASEESTYNPYEYFEMSADQEAGGRYVHEVINGHEAIADVEEDARERLNGDETEGKAKHRPIFMSTNAITLSGKLQIILRFFGEPDDIHKNYDFVHCTNHWQSWDGELVLKQPALEAMLARELRYVGSRYPICSLIRVRKFIHRGWTINAGQILKMAWQINELDLTDLAVLKDQLTGVDVAYFGQLVAKLAEKDPEKVNSAYLVEIIDRMF